LRPRRAAGHMDVDGDDLVHALEHGVVVEHAAGARAGAHGYHPLRLEHLVVDLAKRRRHLVHHTAGDDEQVRLPRRGAETLHAEPSDVIAGGDDRHHLDGAACEAERVGPHRLALRPRDPLLHGCEQEAILDRLDLALEDAGALPAPEHALALQPVVREALLVHLCQRSAPFRQTYTYATARMTMKNASSVKPNQPSSCSTTASG